MVNQDFLPYAILLSVGELLIVLAAVVYIYNYAFQSKKAASQSASSIASDSFLSLWESYIIGLPFESTYRSRLKGYGWALLLVARIVIFSYFFSVGFLYNYINAEGKNAKYFTLWNINAIVVYFFSALVCSVLGLIHDEKKQHAPPRLLPLTRSALERSTQGQTSIWSRSVQNFGFCVQILFEAMGATAIFITVIVFIAISREPSLFNLTDHLVTSLCYLTDMYLNGMIVRWEHIVFMLLWATVYLLFIWPTVAAGAIGQWPYFFLDTSSASCLGVYTGLLVGQLVFYHIWYGLYLLKEKYGNSLYGDRSATQYESSAPELNAALSTVSNPVSGQILAEMRETEPVDLDMI